ncbi:MAG: hypothetical protein RL685_5693 [Pseudomonadota bacterium]|jgi:hypothetical protein
MTTTEPLRGARTSRPETARDPRPSLRRTTCTILTLAIAGQARTHFPARPPNFCLTLEPSQKPPARGAGREMPQF